jgi:cobalt/nickel transport system permease protein
MSQCASNLWTAALHADDFARRDTWLRRLDPRTHVAITVAYLLAAMSLPLHDLSRLILLAAYPVWTSLAGGIPFAYLARRAAIAAPWIVLVAVSWIWLDRRPLVPGHAWPTAGDLAAASLLARLALTVAAASLLLALTGLSGLTAGLLGMRVPPLCVAQLWILHRYALVLSDEAARLLRARELRSAGHRLTWRQAGILLGQLCVRAFDRAERVHRAMGMRGFDGHSLRAFETRTRRLRATDLAYASVMILWILWARFGDGAAGLGRRLMQLAP